MDSRNSSFVLLCAEPEGLELEAPLAVCVFPKLLSSLHVTHILLLRIYFGRARQIPEPDCRKEKVYVHRSVKTRQDAEGLEEEKYKPKVQFDHLSVEIEYVE